MRFTALDGTIHGFATDARVLDLVDFSGTYTSSCASYCEAMGMSCVGAWEENGDTCEVLREETCDSDPGNWGGTSDAICECAPRAKGGH